VHRESRQREVKPDLNRYEDPWTAEVYDYQTQGRGNDLPFWLALAEEATGEILELACGTGRVLIQLARAGFTVTGLDVSPPMLSVAGRKLSREEPQVVGRVTMVEGDMRAFNLDGEFGLIIIPFSAFQTLLERSDQRACLRCCVDHLAPGGRLAIDVFHSRLSRLTVEGPIEEGPREFTGPEGEMVKWSGETEYDLADQRLRSRWRYERTTAAGETTVNDHLLELHYVFRFEMEWMLEACGFEVEALYGDFERSEFTADSPEMIYVARRT
jgi:SAM-dependent methyltransferase